MTTSPSAISPLATAPLETPGHGLLAGKTVVVTAAAGTGIGFSSARRALLEGADVLVSDFHERRLGEAADVSSMVAYLMSDDGSWINGQVVNVDGGTVLR